MSKPITKNSQSQTYSTKQMLIDAFYKYKNLLYQPEIDYFTRSFKNHHHTPIFYGMPKVHKKSFETMTSSQLC